MPCRPFRGPLNPASGSGRALTMSSQAGLLQGVCCVFTQKNDHSYTVSLYKPTTDLCTKQWGHKTLIDPILRKVGVLYAVIWCLTLLQMEFTVRCYAQRGIATASRLSVCLFVTLRYRDHIGWNTWKIISQLVSLGCSLFAYPNIMDLLQRKHPEILAGVKHASCR